MGVANSVWTARQSSSRRSGVVVGTAAAIIVTATLVVVLGFLAVAGRAPGVPSLTLPGSAGGSEPVVVAPDGSDGVGPADDQAVDPRADEAAGDDAAGDDGANQPGDDAG